MGCMIQLAVCAACSEDEDVAPKSLKPGVGDEAQLPADPLKDIKEGIHQAPCSMEFWVVMGTALLCFAAAKYLEFSPSTPIEVISSTNRFSYGFYRSRPTLELCIVQNSLVQDSLYQIISCSEQVIFVIDAYS